MVPMYEDSDRRMELYSEFHDVMDDIFEHDYNKDEIIIKVEEFINKMFIEMDRLILKVDIK